MFLDTGATGFEVKVGKICLDLGETASIDCLIETYGEIANPIPVESVIWSRSNKDTNSFPSNQTLVEYHFQNGVTVRPQYVGHLTITDMYALNIIRVSEVDVDMRYWCKATIRGYSISEHDFEDDDNNPGIGKYDNNVATFRKKVYFHKGCA